MELLLLPLLLLSLLFIPLTLCFLISNKPKSQFESGNTELPPGKTGWPIFGENLGFISMGRKGIPEKFIEDRMNKYSSKIFRTSLLGERMAVFCGASGNKFLFSNENTLVQAWWPHWFYKLFPFDSSIKEISHKLHILLPRFLNPEMMQKHIGIMDSMAIKHLEMDWNHKDFVTVLPLVRKYTFLLSCRLFLSVKDPEQITMFAELFNLISKGILSVPINFPGLPFNRAVEASSIIRGEIRAMIKQRKSDLGEKRMSWTQDLLSHMLIYSDEKGKFMTENDVASAMSLMVLASFDAPGTTLTFIMKYLAELPHVYNEVLKEQTEIANSKGPEELLNWEDIQKMRYSWNVVNETLRLAPPLQGSLREAITDFTYAGFSIPRGWKLYWNAFSTHKNPNYFLDPEKFDPSRFEGDGPAPYSFVPFGGGPRMCPGMQYARLEILVFLHNVIKKFKWEKLIPNEKIVVDPVHRPVKGLPIRLRSHKS